METPIIELRDLTKNYGSLKAVDHLNLTIRKGEIFGLLGPNGAGKSTTILMILGLTEPSSGSISIDGLPPLQNPVAIKRKIGYMPDNVGFYDDMSAKENLSFIGRLNQISEQDIDEKATETLRLVGLEHVMNKKAGTFSRGMKQRLGLADVLIRDPEIIILDEPTLGIDPAGVRDFLALIRQLSAEKGLTVLLSSHHLHQVQQICDRVGIFVSGRLLAEGDIHTLAANLFQTAPYQVEIVLQNPIPDAIKSALRQQNNITQLQSPQPNVLIISSHQNITAETVRYLVLSGQDILSVTNKTYGLDEIYQQYFENNIKENIPHEKSSGFFQRTFIRQAAKTDK